MATWKNLSEAQKNAARKMSSLLHMKGVEAATVSQVTKYLDDCFEWREGEISLKELCDRTGWVVTG